MLGVVAKIFGGKVHPSLELRVFRQIWSRSNVPCSRILYAMGIVWGSTAPLPEVAGKLRCQKAPFWTFDYHTEKSQSFCNVTPGL